MARTESIAIQVHPNDEQEQINFMQTFHWSLLNSQEVKTIDNRLERRGDDIYQTSKTEHYVKLTFSRELDLPNLSEIRRLEQDFNALPYPQSPKLFPIPWWLFAVGTLFYGVGLIAWLLYFVLYYLPKKKEADEVAAESSSKREEILAAVAKF